MDEDKDDIEKILKDIETKKPTEQMGSLEKISEVLNTTFEQDLETIEKQRKHLEQKKQLVAKKEAEGLLILDDQEEIKNGLRSTISNLEMVMSKLQDDIKIGSKAFSHQTYAQCASVLVESYKELADINKTIFDCRLKLQQVMQKNGSKQNGDNAPETFSMTSAQILEMVDKARKNSSINSIDAQFKVIEKEGE